MNKNILYTVLAVFIGGALVFTALSGQDTAPAETTATKALEGTEVTFYRSPSCGCCAGHAAALEAAGAMVDMQNVDEATLQNIKTENGIPFDKQSCHTAIIDDYVIEGHVPVAAMAAFLEEEPDTKGITLPGMPIGTPGMPGRQSEPYIVETLEGDVFWRKDPS